jgi:hypothetical protein
MNLIDKSTEILKTGGKAVYDFFPKKLTFWSVLFYFFLFYFIVYVIFSIYIYVNGLEYEIDCENPENCVKIKQKDTNENKKMDDSEKQNDNINHNINTNTTL